MAAATIWILTILNFQRAEQWTRWNCIREPIFF